MKVNFHDGDTLHGAGYWVEFDGRAELGPFPNADAAASSGSRLVGVCGSEADAADAINNEVLEGAEGAADPLPGADGPPPLFAGNHGGIPALFVWQATGEDGRPDGGRLKAPHLRAWLRKHGEVEIGDRYGCLPVTACVKPGNWVIVEAGGREVQLGPLKALEPAAVVEAADVLRRGLISGRCRGDSSPS